MHKSREDEFILQKNSSRDLGQNKYCLDGAKDDGHSSFVINDAFLESLISPLTWSPDWIQVPHEWVGHMPSAYWLMGEIRPKVFVDLGTHTGNSYFSFCQAVRDKGLTTRCYAVDTWKGDAHAGFYGDEVFDQLNRYNKLKYKDFSTLYRMTFDEALVRFQDRSVELLHIDGMHTYEAVRNDFEAWLPKLAPGALVLFHDIKIRYGDFGVWKLWAELKKQYPRCLEFEHSAGLGILQIGGENKQGKPTWLEPGSKSGDELVKMMEVAGKALIKQNTKANIAPTTEPERRPSSNRPGFWRRLEQSIRKRRKWLQAWIGFDLDWYLNSYPDVAATGIDAFSHYMNYGIKEGRFKNSKDEKKARLVRTGTQQNIEITSDLESRSRSTRKVFIPSNFLQDFGTIQTDIRAIALYLPQFHAIPENDEWWGKGFTEWTNVRRGKPQYEGHYQPHVPHQDLGYYDLNDPSVMEKQASMAKAAGIEGFCFYYYWFNGKRMLNKPTDRMLASGKPDFPFCFCWANENWTRTWDGGDQRILMEQKHSPEDDESFICELLPALRDRRYIRVDGKPLLVVYRPGLLPSPAKTAARWRKVCRKEGVGEICLAFISGFDDFDAAEIGFDAVIQMPPLRAKLPLINGAMQLKNPENFSGQVRDYRGLKEQFCSLPEKNYHWPAVCPSWDNTARRMEQAHSFAHACPESYFLWLENVVEKLQKSRPEGQRIVFINAWNEWGEGCHLEPDEKFGYAWLNATRSALSKRQECQSFKRNPLVAQTLRNKAHFLTGTQDTEQHDDFLAEHAALLEIFRNQGNTFTASNVGLLGKDEKNIFPIEKRADLENLSRAVWGDLEVIPFCFVLLQYNKCDQTLKCVESIKRLGAENLPIQIIIVDNASSEDVVAKTRELFGDDKNISLIFNRKNLGFSGGNNIGYRYARESFGDAFIVVMNNDVVIHESKFVAKCFQLFRDWSYSVLGPDIVTPDGRRENPWNDYVYGPDEWNDFHNLYVHQKEDYLKTGRAAFCRLGERTPQKITSVNPILQGACYIFSPIFTHCHQRPFDESTFLYGEEFPLAIGCLTSGHLMLYSSELAVAHEEGVSTGLLKEQKKMLYGYDGALKGIELASLRLQRHGDATVGRPIGLDAFLIRNLTSDGRRHVLIDLFFCQPGFHGGGEYGKAVFSGLIEEQLRRPDIQIWAAIDPDLFIDGWVWDECRRFAINIVRVKSYDDIVKLVNMNCFYSFFAPAIVVYTGYEYMKRVGGDLKFDDITTTRIVGTLLDLRDFELASQWESIAEARRKAGCSPESERTPKQREAEKARQEKIAQELALMYQRICRHKALKTLITVSSHSAQSIKKNAQCSQPIEVLFAPEKKLAKPESFIWSGIDFENDLYLVMLNAGRFEKNAVSAVAAFDKLFYQSDFASVNTNLKLVLVGLNKVSDLGINKPREHRRIVALPHLSSAQLEYLLTKARGLIYPSFNEGFGYPPLEAMSVGVPCVVSDCTSLPEVCGDAVIYCNPLDVDSIAAGIKKILCHQPNNQKLKEQAARVKSRQTKDLAVLSSLICGISEDSVHTKVAGNKFNSNNVNLSPVAVGGRG